HHPGLTIMDAVGGDVSSQRILLAYRDGSKGHVVPAETVSGIISLGRADGAEDSVNVLDPGLGVETLVGMTGESDWSAWQPVVHGDVDMVAVRDLLASGREDLRREAHNYRGLVSQEDSGDGRGAGGPGEDSLLSRRPLVVVVVACSGCEKVCLVDSSDDS